MFVVNLIFFCLVLVEIARGQECPPNQRYETCGTACPLTCDNYNNPPTFCTLNCKIGCACMPNYVKNTQNNACVLPQNCPGSNSTNNCGPNAQYSTCASPCRPTCQNMGQNIACAAVCTNGCVCNQGFIYDENQKMCIPKEQCQVCGEDMVYSTCGSACPDTCDNWGDESRICTLQCVEGCFCKTGTFLNTLTKKCVKKEECPISPNSTVCKDNEVLKTSGQECDCNNCVQIIQPKCACRDGFIRKNGLCVPRLFCILDYFCRIFDYNAEYSTCVGCPQTCQQRNTQQVCNRPCSAGCKCKEGFYIDQLGRCVTSAGCDSWSSPFLSYLSGPQASSSFSFQFGTPAARQGRSSNHFTNTEIDDNHKSNRHHERHNRSQHKH